MFRASKHGTAFTVTKAARRPIDPGIRSTERTGAPYCAQAAARISMERHVFSRPSLAPGSGLQRAARSGRFAMKCGHVTFGLMKEVVFGLPAAVAVEKLARERDARRVFVMASGSLNRQTDAVARIAHALGKRMTTVFDRVPAHSPRSAVIEATQLAREVAADLIVTVGGGSVTDVGKAVVLCLANGIRASDDLDRLRPPPGMTGTAAGTRAPKVGQIAVPTTLSAGEFSAISGITNEGSQVKELVRHPAMMPTAVVLDPAITVHTPQWLFLSTGIRAIDHCVEGYCSSEAHPYADAQALHGLKLLARGLAKAQSDPADLDARMDCLTGAWLSMTPVALGVPMGASHGIGYVLGAAFGVPHGHTSCVMLPSVLRWNSPMNAARQAQLAAAMDSPGGDAATGLARLIASLELPGNLDAVGIGPDKFDEIARRAMSVSWVSRNPRPITDPAQVREILAMAA